MSQLNLFTGSLTCHYCYGGQPKPGTPNIWHGFRDQDNGKLVCWQCRDEHYVQKAREMGTLKKIKGLQFPAQILEVIEPYVIERMTYSEMPVMI